MEETKNRASFYDLTRKCGEMYKMVSLQQQISRGCVKKQFASLIQKYKPSHVLKKNVVWQ